VMQLDSCHIGTLPDLLKNLALLLKVNSHTLHVSNCMINRNISVQKAGFFFFNVRNLGIYEELGQL
jgi:hypothetical protein